MTYWQHQTATVIPKLNALEELAQIFPSLHTYMPGNIQSSGPGKQHDRSKEEMMGVQRSMSEEMEHELKMARDMLVMEKEENGKLLQTLRMLYEQRQGKKVMFIRENEVESLRMSIQQKQQMLNELHARSLELEQEISSTYLDIREREDRTVEHRQKMEEEAQKITDEITEIEEEGQEVSQRVQQYRLLHTRTKDDRNIAEVRMRQARDLVQKSQNDLQNLMEFRRKMDSVREDLERNLGLSVGQLDHQREEWKASVQRLNEQVSSVKKFQARDKARYFEAERAAHEKERERSRRSIAQKDIETQECMTRLIADLEHECACKRDAWDRVCAAAGVPPNGSVDSIVDSWKSTPRLCSQRKEMENELNSLERAEVEGRDPDAEFSRLEENEIVTSHDDQANSPSAQEDESVTLSKEECTNSSNLFHGSPIAHIHAKAEMSLSYIHEKVSTILKTLEREPWLEQDGSKEAILQAPKPRRKSLQIYPRRVSAVHLAHTRGKKDSGGEMWLDAAMTEQETEEGTDPNHQMPPQPRQSIMAYKDQDGYKIDAQETSSLVQKIHYLASVIRDGDPGVGGKTVDPVEVDTEETVEEGTHSSLREEASDDDASPWISLSVEQNSYPVEKNKEEKILGIEYHKLVGNIDTPQNEHETNPFALEQNTSDSIPVFDRVALKARAKKLLPRLKQQARES